MAELEQQSSEQLAVVLTDLSNRIEKLKVIYEQYFLGIERLAPTQMHQEVGRLLLQLQQAHIRNTALRYRFNTLQQKWSSYGTYWHRTLREIENGTYIRHLQKAARVAAEKGRALPTEMQLRHTEHPTEAPQVVPQGDGPGKLVPPAAQAAAGVKPAPPPLSTKTPIPPLPPGAAAKPAVPPIPGAKPAPPPIPGSKPPALPVGAKPPLPTTTPIPPPPVARPATPPPSSAVPGMSEGELRALHKKYVDARAAAGDNAPIRYESLVASLAKQVPRVLEQPGVRGVRFDVSVQDGKAVLKAIPKK